MGKQDSSRTFSELFAALTEIVFQSRELTALGLTRLQGMALRKINQQSGITMSALAQSIGISNSQLTRVVDTLEDRELARRVRNPKNRRVVNVQRTQQGDDLIKQNIQRVGAQYAAELQTLSPEEQTRLITDLRSTMSLMRKAGMLRVNPAAEEVTAAALRADK